MTSLRNASRSRVAIRRRKASGEQVERMDAYWVKVLIRPYLDAAETCIGAREAITSGNVVVKDAHDNLETFLSDPANLQLLRQAGAVVSETPSGGLSIVLDGQRVIVDDSIRIGDGAVSQLPRIFADAGLDLEKCRILSTQKVTSELLRSKDNVVVAQILEDLEGRGWIEPRKIITVEPVKDSSVASQTG